MENSQIKPKRIPKFTKMQLIWIYGLMLEGHENWAILDKFKQKYHAGNNVLTTQKLQYGFINRLQYHRDTMHDDEHYEAVIRLSQQGISKKNIRLNQLKKRAGETIDKLDAMAETPDYQAELDSPEDTPEYSKTKEYIALNTLLLKQLSHIAEEVGDIKKGVQFNIDNRRIIFEGKAVVSQLDEAGMKALQAKNRVEEDGSE